MKESRETWTPNVVEKLNKFVYFVVVSSAVIFEILFNSILALLYHSDSIKYSLLDIFTFLKNI